MNQEDELFAVLVRHDVPFAIVGGHAVNVHGFARTTEDADVVWLRSPDSESKLLTALTEIDARFIGDDIDPKTGIERAYPVTLAFIQSSHLMMLTTRHGFLDLFDYIPGLPDEDVGKLFTTSVESEGLRYASLTWLRAMKKASNRPKDRTDLENLPDQD